MLHTIEGKYILGFFRNLELMLDYEKSRINVGILGNSEILLEIFGNPEIMVESLENQNYCWIL